MRLIDALRHPRKVFLGWWTVLASGIMTAWSTGLSSYSLGLYFEPLENEFGWTRAEISAASSMSTLEGHLEAPIGGILSDKYGPKLSNFLGVMISGVAFILLSSVKSLWSFLLIWGLVGVGSHLGGWHSLGKALADWFVKKRGIAIGIGRTIQTIGNSFIPTFMLILMMQFGWRTASMIAGLMTFAIGIPLTLLFIRRYRPEYYGMMPDGVKVNPLITKDTESLIKTGQEYTAREVGETEYTLRQALRTRSFWIPLFASAPATLASPFFAIHFIPYLTDMGLSSLAATTALGVMAFVSIPGRLVGGILSDRLHIKRLKWVLVLSRTLEWLGLLVLLTVGGQLWMVYLYACLRGPGMGLSSTARSSIVARYFGRKGYGTINGVRALMNIPITIVSPIYIGWVHDTTGSYITAMQQALILYAVSILIWYFYDPPRQTATLSDVKKFI